MSKQRTGDVKWNKATRLAVAGIVAPHLRDQSERARSRRVAKVDKDGNVIGFTTWAEVQKALLEKQKIELEVVDGVRPKETMCTNCGKIIRPPKMGMVPKHCRGGCKCAVGECGAVVPYAEVGSWLRGGEVALCPTHAAARETPVTCHACGSDIPIIRRGAPRPMYCRNGCPCATTGCGGIVPKKGVSACIKAGRPVRCRRCVNVMRAEVLRRGNAARSRQSFSEASRKGHARQNADQKRERAARHSVVMRARYDGMTPEERKRMTASAREANRRKAG